MRNFLPAFLKAVPGVLLVLIVGATAVGPKEAGANLAKWPPWLATLMLDRRTLFVAAPLLVIYALMLAWPYVRREFALSAIPVLDAARIAFERAEGTELEGFVSGSYQTGDQKLSYFVNAFLVEKLRFYGKRAPSTVSRPIPQSKLAQLHHVEGRDQLVSDFASDAIRYTGVAIDRRDFRRYLRRLKQLSRSLS